MEDFIPVIAILSVFGTITAIIVGPTYFKTRERRDMQKTVRAAIDKGQPLPPEVIEALSNEAARAAPSGMAASIPVSLAAGNIGSTASPVKPVMRGALPA